MLYGYIYMRSHDLHGLCVCVCVCVCVCARARACETDRQTDREGRDKGGGGD